MEKILSQEEIDALFRAARGQQPDGEAAKQRARLVAACNYREVNHISKEQVRAVSALHDVYARNLTRSLGALLRMFFEVRLVSVEQLPFADFLQGVPEICYVASLSLKPIGALAVAQIDLPLAFPVIDILLGGSGESVSEVRDLTEIEEQILEGVVRVICKELTAAWSSVLNVDIAFDTRQHQAHVAGLMSPNERILALSFEIRMAEVRGMLNIAFPSVVANALLRKLTEQKSARNARLAKDNSGVLWQRLQPARFPLELSLAPSRVKARDLLALESGRVLVLGRPATEPGVLVVGGKPMFAVQPIRNGNMRGGLVEQRVD